MLYKLNKGLFVIVLLLSIFVAEVSLGQPQKLTNAEKLRNAKIAKIVLQLIENRQRLLNIKEDLVSTENILREKGNYNVAKTMVIILSSLNSELDRVFYVSKIILSLGVVEQSYQVMYYATVKDSLEYSIENTKTNIKILQVSMPYFENKAVLLQMDKAKDTLRVIQGLYQDALELVKT